MLIIPYEYTPHQKCQCLYSRAAASWGLRSPKRKTLHDDDTEAQTSTLTRKVRLEPGPQQKTTGKATLSASTYIGRTYNLR